MPAELNPSAIPLDRPFFHEENGRQFLILNVEAYYKLTEEQQTAFNHAVHNSPLFKGNAGRIKNYDEMIDKIERSPFVHKSVNIGSHVDDGFLCIDVKQNQRFNNASAEVIYPFLVHHERGHAYYDLKEAGSDYFATVETLIRNPDLRDDFQAIADKRLLHGANVLEKNNQGTRYRHGIETGLAINAALELTDKELSTFGQMPAEQRIALIVEKAREFDDLSDAHDALPADQNPVELVHAYWQPIYAQVGEVIDKAAEKLAEGKGFEELEAQIKALFRKHIDDAPFKPPSEAHEMIRQIDAPAQRQAVRIAVDIKETRELIEILYNLQEDEIKEKNTAPAEPAPQTPPAAPPPGLPPQAAVKAEFPGMKG